MSKLDQTIDNLVNDVKPIKIVASPMSAFSLWFVATLLSSALYLTLVPHRSDIQTQMQSPLFWSESALLLAMIVTMGFSAIWLAYPDLRQKKWVLFMPLPCIATYVGLIVWRSLQNDMPSAAQESVGNGIDCVRCIVVNSIVPGLRMFFYLRRCATTHPILAGGIGLLTSACVGVLILKFVEPNDSVLHLLAWRVTPTLLLGMVGAVIGKKYFFW